MTSYVTRVLYIYVELDLVTCPAIVWQSKKIALRKPLALKDL